MPITVLIVDDHASFRSAARMLLQADGYRVIGEAVDGVSGLSEARRLHPDVVLLDVGLPDQSGLDLAGELAAGPDPPAVVLVSSRDQSDFGRLIERSGARGFIAKSRLSADTLQALIE
ncbi:MAG: response regulator transcription factor [Solirubrobacterales bacterium]|nr:response regulator transcription factor [Solirubrobacterales bacterium]